MSDNAFDIARNLDAAQVGAMYGMTIRNGKALCPAHNDRHPSLSFKRNRFKCWGCGISGSSIDLAMMLLGLSSPLEAVKRLNADFSLGLDLEGRPDPKAVQAHHELSAEHKKFEAWREGFILDLCLVHRLGHLALLAGNELTDAEAEAVRRMAAAEFYAEQLSFGEPEAQMQIFRDRREISRWIERALSNTPMRSKTT